MIDELLNGRTEMLLLTAVLFGGHALYFLITKTYYKSYLFRTKIIDRRDNQIEHTSVTIIFGLVALVALGIVLLR